MRNCLKSSDRHIVQMLWRSLGESWYGSQETKPLHGGGGLWNVGRLPSTLSGIRFLRVGRHTSDRGVRDDAEREARLQNAGCPQNCNVLDVVLGVDMAEETNAILFEPDGSRARLIIREL